MAKTHSGGRLTRAAKAIFLLGASLYAAAVVTEVCAQEEDRPVIKVPRRGGGEAFQVSCVLCHKYDGRGGPSEGGYGADLRVTPLTREQVLHVITYGRMAKGMPAFQGILDEETIDALATYVKEDLKLKE